MVVAIARQLWKRSSNIRSLPSPRPGGDAANSRLHVLRLAEFVTRVATVDGATATMQPGAAPAAGWWSVPSRRRRRQPPRARRPRLPTVVRLRCAADLPGRVSVGQEMSRARSAPDSRQLQLPAPTTDLLLVVQL